MSGSDNSNAPLEFSTFAFHFDSFEGFNQSIKGWSTEFKQVDRGIPSVRMRHRMTQQINALDLTFSHGTYSAGASQPGHRTFGIPDGSGTTSWCGKDVNSNHVLRFDAFSEFHTRTPHGFSARTLSVEEDLLASVAESLGYSDFVERLDCSGEVLEIEEQALRSFRRLYDSPTLSGRDLMRLVEEIVIMTDCACNGRAAPPQQTSSRHLDRALEYITENAMEAVTVAEVCEALNTSYKTLDRCFRQHLGHGPKQSILAYRLSGVRDALRSSDPAIPVGDIARAWGFWHMGQFARVYRAEFGELPSHTLRSE
jgi:AraC family transcriptional regulator, ethanolamine operon transcriptional activator